MSAQRRMVGAFALLGLLAFNLACPGPPAPPEASLCASAPESAAIDGLVVSARHTVGGQGLGMVAVNVEWVGAGAPECAQAEIRLYDETGAYADSTTASLETYETETGRASVSPFYFIRDVCGHVEVESYGLFASAPVDSCGASEDAGIADAGGDAGADAAADAGAGD